MDISELQLKINKNQAVGDLKAVEGQLGKTGEAADGLIDTLRDIGLSIGFGALVKESLQLNKELGALDTRIKTIFKGDFDTSAIRSIASNLNISNTAAKSLLATIGQFASGMGQSDAYVKTFASDLTKAAVDYGTFMGKSSTEEFNEIARKFAKATLGEVGELKEIGIVIDNNSESFKNYVKQIQEATGASEAQARQQAITNKILEQVQHTAGAASKNMFDGWAQLNRLMDEFKVVLAEVGDIFSSVLGPILKVLGDVVEIPFVKSTLAWTIAIGATTVGFIALMKILNKISKTYDEVLYSAQMTGPIQVQLNKISKNWTKETKKVSDNYEKIYKFAKRIPGFSNPGKNLWADLNANEKKQVALQLEKLSPTLSKELKNTQNGFNKLKDELIELGVTFEEIDRYGITGLNTSMISFMQTSQFTNKVLKSTTAATLGAAAAEKILALARIKGIGISSLLGATFEKIKNAFKSIGIFFAAFWNKLVAGATGFAAFKVAFASLGLAFIKITLIVGALYDSFTILKNLLSGNEWSKGTIIGWVAKKIVEYWDDVDFDKLEKRSKELDELNKKAFSEISKVSDLKKELEKLKLERIISKMLPNEVIKDLESKAEKLRKEVSENEWIVKNFGLAKSKGLITFKENETDFEARTRYQEMINNGYKELWSTEDKLYEKRNNLISINKKFANELDNLSKQFNSISETFNYGYDAKGKFGNYVEQAADLNRQYRISELNSRLQRFSRIESPDIKQLEGQKETLQELFNLTKERAKYELDSLWKQRESAISNLKLMNDLVKQATGLRQTSQQSVEAGSTEALQLQSRRYESMPKSELAPMIDQQKQIKEIEKQMLIRQTQSDQTLKNIHSQLVIATKKIGTGSGATSFDVVNPL